jgi:hypothetical protein
VGLANGCSKSTEPRNAGPGASFISASTPTDEIVAFDPTNKEVDDASHIEPLLEKLDDAPASFIGDWAYDRAHVLAAVLARNPAVRFIVSSCKGAVLGSTATAASTQRDLHIRSINEHGHMNWQNRPATIVVRKSKRRSAAISA